MVTYTSHEGISKGLLLLVWWEIKRKAPATDLHDMLKNTSQKLEKMNEYY